MDLTTCTEVLGLPDLEVVAAEKSADGKGWLLTVIPTCSVALCPHCKKASGCRHLVRWQMIHDLPSFGQDVRLKIQVLQFRCLHCDKFFTVSPACVLEDRHVTLRLAEVLTDCVNASTLSAAAATYHLPESTVKQIFEETVQRRRAEQARTLKPITKLGLDEVHLEVHYDSEGPPETAQPAVAIPTAALAESGEKRC